MSTTSTAWLIRLAETIPLQVGFSSAEDRIAHNCLGAMQGLVAMDLVRPKVSDFAALLKAEQEAQRIITARRERERTAIAAA